MRAFAYARPTSLEEALDVLKRPGALPLAGGTDLTTLLKDEVIEPEMLVSLADVADLRGVEHRGSVVHIGAMTPLAELIESADELGLDAVTQAAREIRAPQMLSVGTVGGELCQRPRCWYFRSGFGLLAMQGGRSMVPEGDNRYHAILGSGPAYFVNPSSLAPALSALGARVVVASTQGERRVLIEDLYQVPLREDQSEFSLADGELVVAVEVPTPDGPSGAVSSSYEVRPRTTLDWPLATASVAVTTDSANVVTRAKVVLGHVAPRPWVDLGAGEALVGRELDASAAAGAGAAAASGAKPLSKNAYKVRLAQVATKRAVLKLAAREETA